MSLFQVSFFAVCKLVLVILLGAYFGRRGILDQAARHSLSKIIVNAMLPCLLISSLSRNASISNLGKWSLLPIGAFVFAMCGLLIGNLLSRLFRVPLPLRRLVSTSTSFGNSSYLPMPLLATIAASAPLFANDSGASSRAYAYISVYLLCHSPLLWLYAFPALSGKSWRQLHWRMVINPPLLASGIGILLAIATPLHSLFLQPGAPFHFILDTADMISQGVFPCALLILGANLSERLPAGDSVPWNAYAALVTGRLLIMPVIGYFFTLLVWRLGWIPNDPMFMLVLMIESAVPPATNLMLMCQMHRRGEAAIARLLLCAYCFAIPTLTIAVAFFLRVANSN